MKSVRKNEQKIKNERKKKEGDEYGKKKKGRMKEKIERKKVGLMNGGETEGRGGKM